MQRRRGRRSRGSLLTRLNCTERLTRRIYPFGCIFQGGTVFLPLADHNTCCCQSDPVRTLKSLCATAEAVLLRKYKLMYICKWLNTLLHIHLPQLGPLLKNNITKKLDMWNQKELLQKKILVKVWICPNILFDWFMWPILLLQLWPRWTKWTQRGR